MRARRGGFTLIEVIVVTVIAASLATVLIVRLGGTRDRSFNLLRDRVGDLLLTYAMRAEFADRPIGIGLEPDRRRLLLVRRVEIDGRPAWIADRAVTPIVLPDWVELQNLDFWADGERVDPTYRPLTALPGQTRPRIEVGLRAETDSTWREVHFTLPPQALRPLMQDDHLPEAYAVEREPIDLDASGHWQEDW